MLKKFHCDALELGADELGGDFGDCQGPEDDPRLHPPATRNNYPQGGRSYLTKNYSVHTCKALGAPRFAHLLASIMPILGP